MLVLWCTAIISDRAWKLETRGSQAEGHPCLLKDVQGQPELATRGPASGTDNTNVCQMGGRGDFIKSDTEENVSGATRVVVVIWGWAGVKTESSGQCPEGRQGWAWMPQCGTDWTALRLRLPKGSGGECGRHSCGSQVLMMKGGSGV